MRARPVSREPGQMPGGFVGPAAFFAGFGRQAPNGPLPDAGLQRGGVPGPEASGVAGAGWRPLLGFLEASIDFYPADTDRVGSFRAHARALPRAFSFTPGSSPFVNSTPAASSAFRMSASWYLVM